MAQTYKRLGALDTGASGVATAETLYACPTATSAVVSTISICNRDAAAATYRIGVSTTTSYEDSGMLIYGANVPPNDTIFLTLGVTLDSTNKYLLVSASTTTVSVSAFGVENT
jgi:hypothetical protein